MMTRYNMKKARYKNYQIKIDHQKELCFYSPLLMPFSSNATLNIKTQMLIFELKRDDD